MDWNFTFNAICIGWNQCLLPDLFNFFLSVSSLFVFCSNLIWYRQKRWEWPSIVFQHNVKMWSNKGHSTFLPATYHFPPNFLSVSLRRDEIISLQFVPLSVILMSINLIRHTTKLEGLTKLNPENRPDYNLSRIYVEILLLEYLENSSIGYKAKSLLNT